MEKAGIMRRSNSPLSSALHMVPKPDGSWRPCGDFRRLNNATVPDKYPVPNIRDFTNNVAGSHMFSTLDLVKGYYQVEMFPDDILTSSRRSACSSLFARLLACGMRVQLYSI